MENNMGTFSEISRERLDSCHPDLIKLFEKVVEAFDCSILEGHRGKEEQVKAFANGTSKTMWPLSKHNSTPSDAVDAGPYPIVWPRKDSVDFHKELARWYYFAGFVIGIAEELGIKIRWGGDWDSDREIRDQNFDDLPHFERKP
jgi:peptidoglycan LD-endopeptidase CwlK